MILFVCQKFGLEHILNKIYCAMTAEIRVKLAAIQMFKLWRKYSAQVLVTGKQWTGRISFVIFVLRDF